MAKETKEVKRLLTVQGVAELLHISEDTVWQLAEEGTLPTKFHVGRCARWSVDDVKPLIRLQGLCG
jgi:excisionase family DNA binding protein